MDVSLQKEEWMGDRAEHWKEGRENFGQDVKTNKQITGM